MKEHVRQRKPYLERKYVSAQSLLKLVPSVSDKTKKKEQTNEELITRNLERALQNRDYQSGLSQLKATDVKDFLHWAKQHVSLIKIVTRTQLFFTYIHTYMFCSLLLDCTLLRVCQNEERERNE